MASGEHEATFEFNKYGEPKLLDLKESIAQEIVNALFMVPGNLPSLPHVGVNLKQYLYKPENEVAGADIERKLKEACGVMISGVVINSVDVSIQKTTKGDSVFLILVRMIFPNHINTETVMGVSVVHTKNIVKFNFAFANEDQKP